MIAFIILCYSALYLLIFNKLGLLQKNVKNISAFSGFGVVLIAAIVFAWYTFSPVSADARVFRYIVPIVPNVKGQVTEVAIEAMVPIKKGQLLYRIDPTPYAYSVQQLQGQLQQQQAQLKLAEINVERAEKLLKIKAASQVDLDKWTAGRDAAFAAATSTQAQLGHAQWQLAETAVDAPADGYVVNLQLRPGSYVTTVPLASSLAFVSTESSEVIASFSQSAIRRINTGDEVEVVFNHLPGQVFGGKVNKVSRAGAQSQMTASSQLPTMTGAPVTDRWALRVLLDDETLAATLPQGSGGTMAVYTDAGKPVHIISRVALRMSAWLSYLTSP